MPVEAGEAAEPVGRHAIDRQVDAAGGVGDRAQLRRWLRRGRDEEALGLAAGGERLEDRAPSADPVGHAGSTLAIAQAATPSLPANPSPSDVVPLTETASGFTPSSSATRATISSRRSAIDGRAATTTRSAAAGRQPAAREPFDGAREEVRRVRVRPRCIVGRKERADVPERGRAEQRVDEGVERGVPVRVALRPARLVRKCDAREAHRPAVDEPVSVEPDPPPAAGGRIGGRAGRRGRQLRAHGDEVGGLGELAVGRVAGNDVDGHAGRGEGAGVIGDRASPGVRLLDRGAQRAEAGGLRRLGGHDLFALDRCDHPLAAHALQGVDDRDDRHDRTVHLAAGPYDCRDELRRDRRTGRVVNEDERLVVVAGAGEGPEAGDHRVRPGVASGDDEAASLTGRQRGDEPVDRIGGHGDRDAREVGIGQQDVEAPAPGRAAPEVLPQLVAAHPGRATGRDEDRRVGGVHRPGRRRHSASERGWAKIIRPATVWSTRVTLIGTFVSMNRTPPSTTIIVPSSR